MLTRLKLTRFFVWALDRPNTPEGWWSLAIDQSGKYVVLPGRVQTAPARLIFTKRDGVIRAGIVAEKWYFAGLLEGFVMSEEIINHVSFLYRHYEASKRAWEDLTGQKLGGLVALKQYFDAQAKQLNSPSHPLNAYLSDVKDHLKGIMDGFNMRYASKIQHKEASPLTLSDLLMLNSYSELMDIGAKIMGKHLKIHSNPQTAAAKRLGSKDVFILVQELLTTRISANLLRIASGRDTHTDAWPDVKILWENHYWFPYSLSRAFIRITIKPKHINSNGAISTSQESSEPFGFQFIGFPGQVASTDSFSVSVSPKQFSLSVLRQTDFSSPEGDQSYETSALQISPWLVISTALHRPNTTLHMLVDSWNASLPHLTSTEWKFVVAFDKSLSEIETHFDGFQRTNLTSHMQKHTYILSTSSTTRLNSDQIAKHGYKFNIEKYAIIQSSSADAFNHDAIARTTEFQYLEPGKLLTSTTRPELERAVYELNALFGIFYHSQGEYLELTSMR